MTCEMTGVEEFKASLKNFGPNALKAAGKPLFQITKEVEADSRRNTPVEWGTLEGTHETEFPNYEEEAGAVICRITVGGPTGESPTGAMGYAVPVHERMEVHHERGGAKFLWNAVMKRLRTLHVELAQRLDLQAAWNGTAGVGGEGI